jgi:hypothetical protein
VAAVYRSVGAAQLTRGTWREATGGVWGGGCRASPEGVGGAGGVGEVLELSGHGLDESHGEALLGKIEVRGRV